MAVLRVAPLAIPPFDPQEFEVPELFCVLSTGAIPAPGTAEAVTVEEVAAGAFMLNPDGNVHCASGSPQIPAPAGGALLTVRLAEAVFPVSRVLTKRWLERLL